MFSNAYIEITNICNLSCSFCHKTKRPPKTMTENEFDTALEAVSPYAKNVFFHLMGEPLLHPLLPLFVKKVKSRGIRPIITTNGTLLGRRGDEVIDAAPYTINISLHSFEANDSKTNFDDYLADIFEFSKKAAENGIFCILRLWNGGGEEELNSHILARAKEHFTGEWVDNPRTKGVRSVRIADKIFIEWDNKFFWPDKEAPLYEGESYCLGLKMQLGILSNGTVVPCCLDSDGAVCLGNIFTDKLEDILSSPRAAAIIEGFKRRTAVEELCRRCSYRTRFNKGM